jgi:hypothetical protein
MKRVLCCLLLLFGAFALSPAPIVLREKHALRIHSAAERAAEQRFNGTMGQVGSLPTHHDQYLSGVLQNGSGKALANLEATSPEARNNAKRNLIVAERQLKHQSEGAGMSTLSMLILVMSAVGSVMFGIKFYLDKFGPAPKTFNPSERLRKTV